MAGQTPYTEPNLVTVLILSSFLLLLNVTRGIFHIFCKAGLLGELLIGAIYAASLTDILPIFVQQSVQQLGYLGVMLIITEGGLNARLDILAKPRTLVVASVVGITGIGLPIALTFVLLASGFRYDYLETFAVGASLSATSLGTTLALIAAGHGQQNSKNDSDISRENLINTKAGTVLVGAALLDDIIALVISSVISDLGDKAKQSPEPWTIIRPILSSFLLIGITVLFGQFFARALVSNTVRLPRMHSLTPLVHGYLNDYATQVGAFALVAVIAAFVTISHYIHSSMLIGCFCAGAFIQHTWKTLTKEPSIDRQNSNDCQADPFSPRSTFGALQPVLHYVLQPFFFASIGAAIPVRLLFQRSIAWKGLVYSVVMVVGKLLAGFWLLAPNISSPRTNIFPALFVGLALVARGEIGFLIINIASEHGLVGQEAVMVAIWAIVLNTFVGPICVGLFLRSDRVLQSIFQSEWAMESISGE